MNSWFSYLFIISLLSISSIFVDRQNKQEIALIFFILFCLLFSILIGGRYGIGYDYFNYESIFLDSVLNIPHGSEYNEAMGFYWINDLVSLFTNRFVYLTILISFMSAFLLYYRAYENKELLLTVIFSFLFGFVFFIDNQMKQGVVACAFIFSLKYIFERNFIKYVFFVSVFSALFHLSGFVLVLLYFVPNKAFNITFVLFFCVISFVVSKYYPIYDLYAEYFEYIPMYGEKYSDRVVEENAQYITSGLSYIYHFILVLYLFWNRDVVNNDRMLNLIFLSTVGYVLFVNSEFFERMFFYVIYIKFLAMPVMFNAVKYKGRFYFISLVVISLMSFIYFSLEVINNLNKHGVSEFVWYFTRE